MIHGDFTKLRTKDWRDADVVFANSTCYDEGLMHKIAHLACKFILDIIFCAAALLSYPIIILF